MPKPFRSNQSLSAVTKLTLVVGQLARFVAAMPVAAKTTAAPEHMTREQFYVNLFTSMFLVLAGGVFAGLTLGLMGQDEVYLKVIATSGEPHERKHAYKVLQLIGRGKHWVLVTLLLCNVITNETLPIVLDRCLGGGWPAVVASTASIVIFGEIIPQSISVRYGLQVGSMFAPFVLVLMYLMYPVAYPCALLLDHILGEDHGTVYKKLGLKTLVTLHKTMGVERLNQDEVTIISAVLDLKEKLVAQIMTPIDRVYTMLSDRVLDEKTVEEIFHAGFSRIPIHLPNEPMNFIGMLLVRVLISYDPEDALPVALFPLATLPETGADTSCLNILNYFQEGKSHMIVVSENPGEPTGAMGVLTLEDVIEELIGEEIVDESDVYIDINKNIKRKQPGPLVKRHLASYLHNLYLLTASSSKRNLLDNGTPSLIKANPAVVSPPRNLPLPMLAPLNPAANPLATSKAFVTIKRPADKQLRPGSVPGPDHVPAHLANPDKVFTTEEGALREARDRMHHEMHCKNNDDEDKGHKKSNGHRDPKNNIKNDHKDDDGSDHDGDYDHDHDHDNDNNNNNNDNNNDDHDHDSHDFSSLGRPGARNGSHSGAGYDPGHSPIDISQFSESRLYRTGGIVESVVNVQGVHKTIIEDISEDEPSDIEISSYSSSRRGKYRANTNDELQRLVNF